MGTTLAVDVILRPRLGAYYSARRLRVQIADQTRVWVDVRDRLTDAPVTGATGLAGLYWLSTLGTAETSPAQPFTLTEIEPGVLAGDIPTDVPGSYRVQVSVQGPTEATAELTFDALSGAGSIPGTTTPWNDMLSAAAAAGASGGASATVPVSTAVATAVAAEVGAAAAEPFAESAALSEQITLDALDATISERQLAQQARSDADGFASLADQRATDAAAEVERAKSIADTTSVTVANAAPQAASKAALATAMSALPVGAPGVVYEGAERGNYRKAGSGEAGLLRESDTLPQVQARVDALPVRTEPGRSLPLLHAIRTDFGRMIAEFLGAAEGKTHLRMGQFVATAAPTEPEHAARKVELDALSARIDAAASPLKVRGHRIAVLGDSRFDQSDSGGVAWTDRGPIAWLRMLQPNLQIDIADNTAVGGETTAQVLARVPQVLARNPSCVLYLAHTNDPKPEFGLTVEQSIANAYAAWTELLEAGVPVVVVLDTPRTDAIWTSLGVTPATVRKRVDRFNRAAVQFARSHPGISVANPLRAYTDPVTGGPRAGMTDDGTHEVAPGAYLIGKSISDALDARIAPLSQEWFCPVAGYDATLNPAGNVLANALFTSTQSAVSPATGTIPAGGWSQQGITAPTSGTIQFRVVAAPDGFGSVLEMEAAGFINGLANVDISVRQVVSVPAEWGAGTMVEAMCRAQMATSNGAVKSMHLIVDDTDGTTNLSYNSALIGPTPVWPTDMAQELSLSTPRISVRAPAGTRTMTFRMTVRVDGNAIGGASFLARFWVPSLRRIVTYS